MGEGDGGAQAGRPCLYELGWQNSHTKRFTIFPRRLFFKSCDEVHKFIDSGHTAPPGTEWLIITIPRTADNILCQPPEKDYYHRGDNAYMNYDAFIVELHGGDSYEALLMDTNTGALKRPFADRSWRFGAMCAFERAIKSCTISPDYKWVIKPLETGRPHSPFSPALSWIRGPDIHSDPL